MYTEQERAYVLSNIDKMTAGNIARHINKGRKSLFTFLRNMNISPTEHPALYDVPVSSFTNVTSAEAAYILGFIWADGSLHRPTGGVIVDCVKEDMDILEPIFDKTGEWRKTAIRRPGRRSNRVYRTYNRTLAEYLISKGYLTKSLGTPTDILNTIPSSLRHYFWRGWSDGDGCVHISKRGSPKYSIAGSYDQDWKAVDDIANMLNVSFSTERKHHSGSRSSDVNIRCQDHVITFLDWIYQGFDQDKIGLTRKYAKYLQAKKHVASRQVSKSGYIGVVPEKSGRFAAKVISGSGTNRKQEYIGFYDDPVEAAKAYDAEVFKRRGNKARLNFPHSSSDLE